MFGIFLLIVAMAVAIFIYVRGQKKRRVSRRDESITVEPIEIRAEERVKSKAEAEDVYICHIDTHLPESYIAIDFETATASMMACQLGLVQVENGEIVLERSFLIKPPENVYDDRNIMVHGITPDDTENAPTFAELWPGLLPLFQGRHILAHNASFDWTVLDKNLEYYGLPRPDIAGFECTCAPFGGVSLYSAACYFGIELGKHHDALADAKACALLAEEYRRHFGETLRIPRLKEKSARAVSTENKGWAENLEDIQDNFFKNKTVVITGLLDNYSRDELAAELKNRGARVTSSVSKRTSVVIVGQAAGPAKLEKIQELRKEGAHIETINEDRLRKILNE